MSDSRSQDGKPDGVSDERFSTADTARLLPGRPYSPKALARMCDEGKILAYKLHDSGHWWIPEEEVKRMVERLGGEWDR